MRRGYRFGDRVLRPAMVAVTDSDGAAPRPTGAGRLGAAAELARPDRVRDHNPVGRPGPDRERSSPDDERP